MDLLGLERALTVLAARSRVLSDNLANANTPLYTRRDVPFFSVMRRVLEGEPQTAIPVATDLTPSARGDGNNTVPERELASLSQTAIMYRATMQLAAREFALLRTAITEGRR